MSKVVTGIVSRVVELGIFFAAAIGLALLLLAMRWGYKFNSIRRRRKRSGKIESNPDMTTATIQVSGLKKGELAALRRQAKSLGMSDQTYARQLIEEGISLEHRARTQSFDQILAPVRAEFRKSGMTEDELDKLASAARTRHQERKSRKKR
jgi:hypothetical protein